MTQLIPDSYKLDPETAKMAEKALKKLAEMGQRMTPADHRAQLKSYALGAAKTKEARERLSKLWDRRNGV